MNFIPCTDPCIYQKDGSCTLSRAENDEVAKRFAAAHPEFLPIVQPVPYAGAAGDPTRTYCPDENGGDGFFTASFRRVK